VLPRRVEIAIGRMQIMVMTNVETELDIAISARGVVEMTSSSARLLKTHLSPHCFKSRATTMVKEYLLSVTTPPIY
jgi:hypothetical protein